MKGGLGNMPLTLFVIVAGIVLYFYIRRANLGIDLHPGETKARVAPAPPAATPRGAPSGAPVTINPTVPLFTY